jgi:hypothetical protein
MLDYLPLMVMLGVLGLTLVVMEYFDLNTDRYPLVMFFFGLLSIGLVLFGFYEPTLLLFGVIAVGIAIYVEFVR